MNIFQKIFSFFKKTKETASNIKLKVQTYIKKHSKEIKTLMSIYELMFPAGAGIEKMALCVKSVCSAIGIIPEDLTPVIVDFVKKELQKQYDKFKEELG
jgi:hypothetical protein